MAGPTGVSSIGGLVARLLGGLCLAVDLPLGSICSCLAFGARTGGDCSLAKWSQDKLSLEHQSVR